MSMPDVERLSEAPWRSPSWESEKTAESAEYSGADGLYGVTQCRNGRRAFNAVKNEFGVESGRAAANG